MKKHLLCTIFVLCLLQGLTQKPADMKMNAGIITKKLNETKAFYQQILHFTIVFENDFYILLESPGGDRISFLVPDHPTQKPIFQKAFKGKGVFLTIETGEVDEEYKRIKKLGIKMEVDLRDEPWGDRHFAFYDPNGIGIDIVKYTPPAK